MATSPIGGAGYSPTQYPSAPEAVGTSNTTTGGAPSSTRQNQFPGLSARPTLAAHRGLPQGKVAQMADGTLVASTETVDRSSNGLPTAIRGVFSFPDEKLKRADKTGLFEYDARITPDVVDLQNIFNNSKKKNALDFVILHLTKNAPQKNFMISGISNDDLYSICKSNYKMSKGQGDSMIGDLAVTRDAASKRLQSAGWKIG